jgi:hypothetical protein
MKITNDHKIDLPLAVWLLQDGYNSGANKNPNPNLELLSVTTLLKPTRQLILQRKVPMEDREMDLADMIASRMGHSIHDGIERAWTEGDVGKALKQMHYPQKIIDRIRINPNPKTLLKDHIPIYLEKRGFREVGGIMLTGQLDFAINGSYRDFKSTSTFSFTSGSKDEDYRLQGSMYRYIMPEYIWRDEMRIEFIFTDWQRFMAKQNPNYPQTKVAHKDFVLLNLKETEEWIQEKLQDIRKNAGKNQDRMVRCSDKELWRSDDAWKYYSNPETAKKGGRCTKRFDNESDAQLHLSSKGKGTVVKEPGTPKACAYCPAFLVCEQRKEYFQDNGEPI